MELNFYTFFLFENLELFKEQKKFILKGRNYEIMKL